MPTPVFPASDNSGHPSQTSGGKVWLVGAGPGDPGLITVRGKTLLELADTVVYDALCNPRLLRHAPRAEHIYVGKRAAQHTLTQDQINQLLVDLAKQGKKVVRLKGGDPFVFGRGGEECAVLAAAGLPFEIVPGITAAIAAMSATAAALLASGWRRMNFRASSTAPAGRARIGRPSSQRPRSARKAAAES